MDFLLNFWRYFWKIIRTKYENDVSEVENSADKSILNEDQSDKNNLCLDQDDVFQQLVQEIKENTVKISELKSLLKYDLTHMADLIYLKNRNVEILLKLFRYRDYKIDVKKHDFNLKWIRSKLEVNNRNLQTVSEPFRCLDVQDQEQDCFQDAYACIFIKDSYTF